MILYQSIYIRRTIRYEARSIDKTVAELLQEIRLYNINYNDTSIQSRDWDLVVCTTYEGVVSDVLMLFTNNLFLLLLLFLLLFLFNTLIL